MSTVVKSIRTSSKFPVVGQSKLAEFADIGLQLIERARVSALDPNTIKVLRRFTGPEATAFLGGIHVETLYRRLKKDKTLPQGEQVSARRREFTLEEIHTLQAAFGIRPRKPQGARAKVISVSQFKGGIAKTTQSAHLAQYLCLHGYRVLLVDLDPQSSLTQLFAISPVHDVAVSDTVLPYFEGPTLPGNEPNPNWTGTLQTAVRKTHWHDLDLICASVSLAGAEFAIANRAVNEQGFPFHRLLAEGLNTVKDDYDVIVLDTAPSLSFMNTNALFAADALVLPVPPASLDLQSAAMFFQMAAEVVETFNQYEGEEKQFDFTAILISRFKSNERAHQDISAWIRNDFGAITIDHSMLESTAYEKLAKSVLTLYECETYEGSRETLDRALEAQNLVNQEIELALRSSWSNSQVDAAASVRAAS